MSHVEVLNRLYRYGYMIAGSGRWVSLMLKRPKKKGAKKMQTPIAIPNRAQDEDEDKYEGSDTEYSDNESVSDAPLHYIRPLMSRTGC